MGRKVIAVFLLVWILAMAPITAFAQEFDPDRMGCVSVTLIDRDGETPITGAELSLYYVATVAHNSSHLNYIFTDTFANCGCVLDDPALTATLDAFVTEYAAPVQKQVTDAQGYAAFADLPLGLYFVKQTGTVAGYAPCTSFLVTVPNSDDGGYVYDVNASPKTDIARLTDITVRKVWNTDASAQATDSVTIQLQKDGIVVETAILSEENNWQITYTDMPESDAYRIVEVNVPKGFTVTYSQNGYVFTATNSASLIQTGQLIWPIPVLALAGLCLIAVGTLALSKTRKQHA